MCCCICCCMCWCCCCCCWSCNGVVGGVKGCSRSDPGLDWGVLVLVPLELEDEEVDDDVDEEDIGPALETVLIVFDEVPAPFPLVQFPFPPAPEPADAAPASLEPGWGRRRRGWYLYSGCSLLCRSLKRSASRWNGIFSSSFNILQRIIGGLISGSDSYKFSLRYFTKTVMRVLKLLKLFVCEMTPMLLGVAAGRHMANDFRVTRPWQS